MLLVKQCKRCSWGGEVLQAQGWMWRGLRFSLSPACTGNCCLLCRPFLVLAGTKHVFMCRQRLSLHLDSLDGGWAADCICQPCFGWSQPACSLRDLCFPRKLWPVWRGREQVRHEGKTAKGGEKELRVSSHAQLRVASGMYWSFAVTGGGMRVRINLRSLAGC